MGKGLTLVLVPVVVVVALIGALVLLGPRLFPGLINIQVGNGGAAAAPPAVYSSAQVPVTLGERVVNLADPGGFRYLKTEIVLNFAGPGIADVGVDPDKLAQEQARLNLVIEPVRPQVQDILTMVLTSRTVADVSTAEGKEALKEELRELLQPLFPDYRLDAIYFTQFIIQ